MSVHRLGVRLHLVALAVVVLAAFLTSCKERDPLFCDANTPCTNPARPICNTNKDECEPSSISGGDMDMAADMATGVDASAMCTASSQCMDSEPICSANVCRVCSGGGDDGQCALHNAATPRCGSSGTCVACTTATQASDCSGATPICGSDNSCRACQAHSECASGICVFDGASAGSCAAASQIAYVDNKGSVTTCSANGMTHDGNAPATAFCDIQNAVSTSKPYVLVAGQTPSGTSAYSKVSITSARTVTIVGPGQGAAAPATIYDPTNVGLTISLSGSGVSGTVIVDGLEIGDRSNASLQDAVDCTASGGASATLVVRRTAIQHSSKLGVNSNGCDATMGSTLVENNVMGGLQFTTSDLEMDASLVENNSGGGIQLSTSDFTIENTVIALNGSASSGFGGVQSIGTGSVGRAQLINDTIVKNTAATGGYSALDCPPANSMAIFNSVVEGNLNTTEIRSTCTLGYSSFAGATAASGNGNTDITGCTDASLFVNTGANPYTPLSTVTAPCTVTLLGKGTSSYMGIAAPNHDLLGAARPQPAGSMPDDGAYEIP